MAMQMLTEIQKPEKNTSCVRFFKQRDQEQPQGYEPARARSNQADCLKTVDV